MSEHKFLRILHGFAEGMPIQALEPTTRVSGKTIRATYGALRGGIVTAAQNDPERFGGAGHMLLHSDARHLLHAVRRSPRYRRHRKRHAPRLSCPLQETALVMEKAVRLICRLDLRALPLHEDEIARSDLLHQLADAIPRLHPRDPIQKLCEYIPGARPHAHPELRLYEDYRRTLLKNPLGTR